MGCRPVAVVMGLAVGLALGCERVACPSEVWCEGDTRVTCRLVCTGGGTGKGGGLPTSCDRQIERQDCVQYGLDTFGVPKTCQSFHDADSQFFQCVDKPLSACTLPSVGIDIMRGVPLACGPGDSVLACQGTDAQAFLDTNFCEVPGRACVALSRGITCVDAPRAPCDPGLFPRCDGSSVKSCVGSSDAGFFVTTKDCGTNPGFVIACVERDGGAACVSVPRDGGP